MGTGIDHGRVAPEGKEEGRRGCSKRDGLIVK